MFGCRHKHMSRVFTPKRVGVAHAESYVVCLDCSAKFAYDWETMTRGKGIKPEVVPITWGNSQEARQNA